MNAKVQKLDYVDALRAIAILGVLIVHVNQSGAIAMPKIFSKIANEGARGVQLFYVASAFTLFLSLKNRAQIESHSIRNFFIRRFFRIAPMYYLGICYYLFQDGFGARYWLGDETHITALNIASNFTFTHAFNPYWINSLVPGGWSIGVEMCFYAIVPFIFFRIKNTNQAFHFFIVTLLLRYALHILLIHLHTISDAWLWQAYLLLYFPSQLPIFALGILLYFLLMDNKWGGGGGISSQSMLTFALLILLQLASEVEFLFNKQILFGIAFVCLAIALEKRPLKMLVHPAFLFIGKISFSLYLVHFAVINALLHFHALDVFQNGLLNFAYKFIVVSFFSIAFASFCYKFIESPCQKFGHNIIIYLERNNEI